MSDRKAELADVASVSRNLLKKGGSLSKTKAFIQSYVKDVKVTGNEVVPTYTMPVLSEKVTLKKKELYLLHL
jgi:hypothetical protein